MSTSIAIIPARGGSKRIPDKNVRDFYGKPIISYSIQAAKSSNLFQQVIVSTDSEKIACVATEFGAEVPFMRPASLSGDRTPTVDVLLHVLDELYRDQGYRPDFVCCILATAPMMQAADLQRGYEIVSTGQAPAAFSVTTFQFPILRALRMGTTGGMEMVWPEHELTRSNDFPDFYHDAGQFYWIESHALQRERRVYLREARPVVVPRRRVQDIDTMEDWEMAEALFGNLRQD